MNEALRSRLLNWKFKQALGYIDNSVTEEAKGSIEALARLFGDCGWFEGDIGTLVSATVRELTGEE